MLKSNPVKQIEFRYMVAEIVKQMAKGALDSNEVIERLEKMENWVDAYITDEVHKWIKQNSKIGFTKRGKA